MWQRPFLQSESCTRSQPSPASTSFSSPSWLDAPINGKNVRKAGWWIILRFPSFNSPVASALFHHIWQHWPISCASSWNAFDWTLVFNIAFDRKRENSHGHLSRRLLLFHFPSEYRLAGSLLHQHKGYHRALVQTIKRAPVPTLGTTLHLRSLSNMR